MSFKSGSSKTQQSQTVTPTMPDWATSPIQQLAGQIGGLGDPNQYVAGASPLQSQTFDQIGNALGLAGPAFSQAMNLANTGANGYTPSMVTAASPGSVAQATASAGSDYLGNYFNPYTSEVIGNATNDLNRARLLTQNSNGQGAIAAGQYGGSRQGVLDANADEGFLRSVGNMAGQLRHQGFTTAAGLGMADADRFTNTSQFNAGQQNSMAALQAQLQQQAGLANQGASNQAGQFNAGQNLQAANLLGGLGGNLLQYGLDAGGAQRGINQDFAGSPLSLLGFQTGALGSLPLNLYQGQTSTGTSSQKQSGFGIGLGDIAKIGQFIMSSDPRLKEDILPVERDPQGRMIYAFSYKDDHPDQPMRLGYMADELAQSDPDAVLQDPQGMGAVDYGRIAQKNLLATGGQPAPNIVTPSDMGLQGPSPVPALTQPQTPQLPGANPFAALAGGGEVQAELPQAFNPFSLVGPRHPAPPRPSGRSPARGLFARYQGG